MYPKDTEKWKQFTTFETFADVARLLFCIPKILKNESNSQPSRTTNFATRCCFVSQRYWKMKAIHNYRLSSRNHSVVVLYPKDTEKWKQFTTSRRLQELEFRLFCIPKILKNESNSQQILSLFLSFLCCFVSQRYWKMKAIHNNYRNRAETQTVVLYPKDTEKWKQFTTSFFLLRYSKWLFCIPKILKNEI